MEEGDNESMGMEEKEIIRKRMKELRRTLEKEERERMAAEIEKELLCMKEFKECGFFFAYLSYGAEVPTQAMIRAALKAGKTVAAPKVTGEGQMAFYSMEDLDSLVPGAFGILEPKEETMLTPAMGRTFLLLPGLAFTRRGDRLGYGGGYYDRYLKTYPEVFSAAPAYPFSVLENLPVKEHDVRANALLLPGEIVYTDGNIFKETLIQSSLP